MKKFLLLLLTVILISNSCLAQVFIPLSGGHIDSIASIKHSVKKPKKMTIKLKKQYTEVFLTKGQSQKMGRGEDSTVDIMPFIGYEY